MICRNCGTEFETKKRGRKNNGFCCKHCADNWRQHNVYDLKPKKYEKCCAYCNEDFMTNQEKQKYCSVQCRTGASRTGRTEYTKSCLYCKTEFKTIYKNNKYCSSACASRHGAALRRGEYFCEYCGQPRHSDHPNRNRFCSMECSTKYRVLQYLPVKLQREKEKQELKRQREIEMTRSCDFCGETFVAVNIANRFCSYECCYNGALKANHDKNLEQFVPEQRTCLQCGVVFTTTFEKQRCLYCSDRCANRHHDIEYEKKRSQQMKEAFVEPVGLKTTYKSCNGVCGICGLPVPKVNDPASDWGPTIDHIVPLSKGGKHKKTNCQLAHRLCNSLKLDTTDEFKIDWRQKLINEPGRWNTRLDRLWEELGVSEEKEQPMKIAVRTTTTVSEWGSTMLTPAPCGV